MNKNIIKTDFTGIIPDRIREARLTRGYSLVELASLMDNIITKQAINQYELGQVTPSPEKVEILANVLDFPYGYFYKPINYSLNKPIFFRKFKTSQNKERLMIESRMKLVIEILEYLEKFIKFSEPKVIRKQIIKSYTKEEIEQVALEVRESWGIGLGPISDINLLLENNGIVISKATLGSRKMDACSNDYLNRPLFFLSEDKSSAVRSRFDAAHELGHIVLHSVWVKSGYIDDKEHHDRLEDEANQFASAFLMPDKSFAKEIFSTSIDSLITLKNRWKVSIGAMIRRGYDLEIFSKNQYEYLIRQYSARGFRLREPLDNSIPIEKTRTLNKAINLLLSHKVQTVEQILDALQLSANEIEILCNLTKGTLDIDNKTPSLRLIKS